MAALWLVLTLPAPADQLDQWIWRNPLPFNPSIISVVHGNGLWLAVANMGLVATSPDGGAWDLAGIGTNASVSACAYGTTRFVLGSSKGVYFSTDGHNWSRAATSLNTVSDMAYGNGRFVSVNFDYMAWRSVDGSAWSSGPAAPVGSVFNHVSFANGKFFILGTDNLSVNPHYFLYTSTDGSAWAGPVSLNTNGLIRVVYGNGVYVGLNQVLSGTATWSEFRTSPDGATWSAPVQWTNHIFSDALFTNGQFVVLDEIGEILTSPDATNWVEHAEPQLLGAVKITRDGALSVVAGVFGTLFTSTDNTNWVRRTTGPQNSILSLTHSGGLYVGVGGNFVPGSADFYSTSTAVTSTDGRNWAEHASGTTNSLWAVTAGNGRFVAVGTNGTVVASTDGTNWSALASPTTNMLWGVAYGTGRFVAVGGTTNTQTFITSSDGANWTAETLPLNYGPMYAITYGQGQFVALGQLNTALISSDGLVWQPESSAATNNLRAITFGNGVYVAVGDRGALSTSSDGVTWANRSLNSTIYWYGVAYGHGWYVAIGSSGALGLSSNAVDWSVRGPFRAVSLAPSYGIVSGDNSFLLGGRFGQVLESGPFNVPTPQITLGLRLTDRPFLSFTAPEWHGFEIDSSDVLPPAWVPLATVTNLSATTALPVSAATNSPARFYRMKLLY